MPAPTETRPADWDARLAEFGMPWHTPLTAPPDDAAVIAETDRRFAELDRQLAAERLVCHGSDEPHTWFCGPVVPPDAQPPDDFTLLTKLQAWQAGYRAGYARGVEHGKPAQMLTPPYGCASPNCGCASICAADGMPIARSGDERPHQDLIRPPEPRPWRCPEAEPCQTPGMPDCRCSARAFPLPSDTEAVSA